jgi:hypothetical protein
VRCIRQGIITKELYDCSRASQLALKKLKKSRNSRPAKDKESKLSTI